MVGGCRGGWVSWWVGVVVDRCLDGVGVMVSGWWGGCHGGRVGVGGCRGGWVSWWVGVVVDRCLDGVGVMVSGWWGGCHGGRVGVGGCRGGKIGVGVVVGWVEWDGIWRVVVS